MPAAFIFCAASSMNGLPVLRVTSKTGIAIPNTKIIRTAHETAALVKEELPQKSHFVPLGFCFLK